MVPVEREAVHGDDVDVRRGRPCSSMFWMNRGSIGEMPPSTRGSLGSRPRSRRAASFTISANVSQSGSISKSQCDLLLGSFQNITASIMRALPGGWIDGMAVRAGRASSSRQRQMKTSSSGCSTISKPALRSIASTQARFGIHQLVGSPA